MEFKYILKKINNTLSEEEIKIFDAWYNESNEHRIYFHRVKKSYDRGLDEVDIKKGWNNVSSKIADRKNWQKYLKYAVTIAILLTTGSLLFFNVDKKGVPPFEKSASATEKNIEIGTDKATLTLEDGSQIALLKGSNYEMGKASSNGEQLVYKADQEIQEKTIAQNVLTIPRGGQFFVVFADGTKVWVNSETQLKYPVSFAADKTREVKLVYGEAYFEVSPGSDHNGSGFIVHTENQKVEVLGTEFNIKAYKEEENLSTTLVEGSVKIEAGGNVENLAPGHQSNLNRITNGFTISKVDVDDEISWKNGLFSFKKKPLKDIMKVLSRWYDVDVVFENKAMEKITFNGIFRKTQDIDEILNIIRNTNEINFEIDKKTILMK